LTACELVRDFSGVFTPTNESNQLKSNENNTWQRVSTSGLARVSTPHGEVLAIRSLGEPLSRLVSVSSAGEINAWMITSGVSLAIGTLSVKPDLAALGEVHPLVAYSVGPKIIVETVPLSKQRWELTRLKAAPVSIAFHTDDSALLIGAADARVYRWRFRAEDSASTFRDLDKTLERYIAHQTVVSSVAAHPFGRAFFSGDWQGNLYGWLSYDSDDFKGEYNQNLFYGRAFAEPGKFSKGDRPRDRGVVSLAPSNDGERLTVGTEDGYIESWRVRGFVKTARRQGHNGRVYSVGCSTNGLTIASVGRDGLVKVFKVERDPGFGITAGALTERLSEIASFKLPTARRIGIVSSGRVIVTTTDGKIAELTYNTQLEGKLPTPVPTPADLTSRDRDYGL